MQASGIGNHAGVDGSAARHVSGRGGRGDVWVWVECGRNVGVLIVLLSSFFLMGKNSMDGCRDSRLRVAASGYTYMYYLLNTSCGHFSPLAPSPKTALRIQFWNRVPLWSWLIFYESNPLSAIFDQGTYTYTILSYCNRVMMNYTYEMANKKQQ